MILLQMLFLVDSANADRFEEVFSADYVQALRRQVGYTRARLLRKYDDRRAAEIEAEATPYNYGIEIEFDSEENRRRWAASPEHEAVWPRVEALYSDATHFGFDVVAFDEPQ